MSQTRILCLVLCLVFLCSCAGSVTTSERIHRYLLEYPPPQISGLEPLDVVIRVDRFTAAAPYNQDLIVYRDEDFQRQTYYYHRWRVVPADMVSDFTARDLRSSRLYRAVLRYDSHSTTRFKLEGDITEFLEEDQKGTRFAVFSIDVILGDEGTRDSSKWVVWQKHYSFRERCEGKGVRSLVEATSRAVGSFSQELNKDIHEGIAARLAYMEQQ